MRLRKDFLGLNARGNIDASGSRVKIITTRLQKKHAARRESPWHERRRYARLSRRTSLVFSHRSGAEIARRKRTDSWTRNQPASRPSRSPSWSSSRRKASTATDASKDFHLFYVGRDDVHDILKYLLERVSTSLYLNMFGYDDDELNAQCMRCATDGSVTTVITLDKSQAGGVHEKTILASDVAQDASAFNAHFAVGQSATSQISHTKGGVLDGKVGFEGSTNWSSRAKVRLS